MRQKNIRAKAWIIGGLVALPLGACGPSEKHRAEQAEQARIECLDKFCPGDVEPKRDLANEVALKVNGQWYIGPKKYFASGHGAAFYWPGKTAAYAPGDFPPGVKGRDFYDVAIEIFLLSKPIVPIARSTYQLLLNEESQGHVIDKRKPRDGLEVWRTRDGVFEETWYIAVNLKDPSGDPAVAACRGADPTRGRCNAGFLWQPDVAANLRFRAIHGPDWPEIFLETTHVLRLLRRA